MKSIFKILVLGVVPILMATAVVDQGLAADKGSQLIFQSNMAHKNFISVTNTADKKAVTVLTQYYNDEMKRVLWYLRVIPGSGTVLVDAFDHMIPGTASDDDMDGTNVSEILGALPAMSTDKKAGTNSGHFVIAVTAVGMNYAEDENDDGDTTDAGEPNARATVNVLFPTFLAKDMHGTDNIDNCGTFIRAELDADPDTADTPLVYTEFGADGVNDCRKASGTGVTPVVTADTTSKNVGGLSVDNAQPIAFNHLTGHFTEALMSTPTGGADQTASWGGTPVVRPGVDDASNAMAIVMDYWTLTGANAATAGGGRLAEKDAGGMGATLTFTGARTAYTAPSDIADEEDDATNRAIDATGALVLPALHGGGDETKQIMLLLSAADDFGGAGKYELIAAKTGYKVVLMDNMGDALPDPAAEAGPVFGGVDDPDAPAGVNIIVDGIRVMTNADHGKCTGTAIMGPWMLDHLTSLVPTALSGAKEFAGLNAMLMGSMNASPGWIKFMRSELTCKENYGDGDAATGSTVEDPDGVPTKEERTYKAGTLVVEQKDSKRAFVTTGRALLKLITADSTFAASWSLKSPASPTADDTTDD